MFVAGVGLGALPGVNNGDGGRPERPYFDDVSPRNVSAVVGQSAVLRCRAKHIGNRTVSNVHLLICSVTYAYILSLPSMVDEDRKLRRIF